MSFCLLNFYSTPEFNQRALVGKSAAVLPGIADETAEDAINATRRYSITLLGDQISRKLLDIFTLHLKFYYVITCMSFSYRFVEFVNELEVKQNRAQTSVNGCFRHNLNAK